MRERFGIRVGRGCDIEAPMRLTSLTLLAPSTRLYLCGFTERSSGSAIGAEGANALTSSDESRFLMS